MRHFALHPGLAEGDTTYSMWPPQILAIGFIPRLDKQNTRMAPTEFSIAASAFDS